MLNARASQLLVNACFCLVVFLGAFLLFQIEPVAGKIVTPKFGGTASVWTLLLLFFQLVMLLGYGAVYCITKASLPRQACIYGGLCLAAVIYLLNGTNISWDGTLAGNPQLGLLTVLTLQLAIPCVVLATISGIMQIWYQASTQQNPYPLYSVSNIGSLAALLSYPLLIEPNFGLQSTIGIWRIAYIVLMIACLALAVLIFRRRVSPQEADYESINDGKSVSVPTFAYWIFLGALGSALLLSITTFITQDVAPVPLLWIPPLAVYLLSFIIAFAGPTFYSRPLIASLLLLAVSLFPLIEFGVPFFPLPILIPSAILFLFIGCLVCQGELYYTKPTAQHLPVFYFAMALGGAVGGIAINFIAPSVLSLSTERWIVVALSGCLGVGVALKTNLKEMSQSAMKAAGFSSLLWLVGISLGVTCLIHVNNDNDKRRIYHQRNFYGSLTVLKLADRLVLHNGRTMHGYQFIDPKRKKDTAHYYQKVLNLLDKVMRESKPGPVKFGVIGLGVGSVAAWGRPEDSVTFYELDPKVELVARRYFTFLSDCPAHLKIVLGDARTSLNHESPNGFDILLVDAFNSDAIPLHLLTLEALSLYERHLAPGGIISVHVSNHYLDLAPVLADAGKTLGLKSFFLADGSIRYVLFTKDQAVSDRLAMAAPGQHLNFSPNEPMPNVKHWTDDFNNLLSVLTFR